MKTSFTTSSRLLSLPTGFLNRFIFLQGGAYNAAIARMLLAVSLWLSIKAVGHAIAWDYYVEAYQSVGWVPKGLVKILDLFSAGPPSQPFVVALFQVSQVACLTMFLGLFSRTSAIVAALSATLYASLMTSFGPYWSHGLNVQLLAALSFMFGRSGDVLSLDAAIRRWRSLPSPLKKHDGEYWWPVLFAELATHMFMFGAFYQKFTQGNGVWWAWSDNLRNSLAIAWGISRFNPPDIVLWVANNPWLYKTAGTLQLIAQVSTIFCLFLVRHPVLRLVIGGVFFFLEIIGLSRLFEFWHPFWIPLCFLSVDWEWLYNKLRGKDVRPMLATTRGFDLSAMMAAFQSRSLMVVDNVSSGYRLAVYSFMALFFGYYAANIVWKLGETHLNYPFSSMAFYSENRALPPYSKPNYFPIHRGWVEVETKEKKLLDPIVMSSTMVDSAWRAERSEDGQRKLHAAELALVKVATWSNSPEIQKEEVGRLRTYLQVVAVPPRPAAALPLVVLHSGLTSVSDELGFRGVNPSLEYHEKEQQFSITVDAFGFKNPTFRMLAREDVAEKPSQSEPFVLPGEWQGNHFYVSKEGIRSTKYVLIEVTDKELGISEVYAGPKAFVTGLSPSSAADL